MKIKRRGNHGFTVIELFLVLIAIGFLVFVVIKVHGCNSSGKKSPKSTPEVSTKTAKHIQEKLNDLRQLRSKLSQKKKEVDGLRASYIVGIDQLKKEIKGEMKARNIKTFEQAKTSSRISYDLALIQRKQAYITKLDEIGTRLEAGAYELEYLERQAADDLSMATVLSSEETSKIINDINVVINKYMPDSNKLVVNIDESSLPSLEQIWQDINSQTNK